MRFQRHMLTVSALSVSYAIQTLPAQTLPSAATPALDAALVDYFNYLSSPYTFQQRIQFATAERGSIPEGITVEEHRIERTVNHIPYYAGMPDPVLGEAVGNSDVILSGRALSSRSVADNDQRFLFTEYAVHVDSVYMDVTHTVNPGDTILIATEGGSLPVDGVQLTMADPAFDRFALQTPYIFSLKAIRHTGAFKAVIPWCFNMAGPYETSASRLDRTYEKRRTPGEFVAALQVVIQTTAAHRRRERPPMGLN